MLLLMVSVVISLSLRPPFCLLRPAYSQIGLSPCVAVSQSVLKRLNLPCRE